MAAVGPGAAGRAPARLVLGSRRSRLAVVQAERVAERLRAAWPGLEVVVVGVETEGDRLDRALPEIGGKGLFTAELEARLLSGEMDAAVHSLKDLPTALAEGLALACVPERADPADLLLLRKGSAGLEELPAGCVVGTSSLRRSAQLLALRPDLVARSIRGNVETRIRKCRAGEYDAVILAAAGVARLRLDEPHAVRLAPPGWLPAVGQGAIAVEARAADRETARRLGAIEDPRARAAAECERALLARLEGGCRVPIGAWAREERGRLRADAAVFSPDGRRSARDRLEGSLAEPATLGRALAERLLVLGAAELLASAVEEG